MPKKQHIIELSERERLELEDIVRKNTHKRGSSVEHNRCCGAMPVKQTVESLNNMGFDR